MFIIYDLIFFLFILIQFPVYLFKGKLKKDFLPRFGFLPRRLNLGRPIWIHAVSVGEAQAVKTLLLELKKIYPEKRFVISTVTVTGNKIVRGYAAADDFVTYLPLDLSFIVRGVVKKINPCLFIMVETEIWPNIIRTLENRGVPAVMVTGRLSESSLRGYKMIKPALKYVLDRISFCCVQSENDKARFQEIGFEPEKIIVTGNMKFDASLAEDIPKEDRQLRDKLKIKETDRLLVCGSTHKGEEELILEAYKKLAGDFPDLRLLIAPRHPERSPGIRDLAAKTGLDAKAISSLRQGEISSGKEIFILDTIGRLLGYYSIADIVFVGGSLVDKGGHNILEPASLNKPVIFGPFMSNFRDIAGLFTANNAAIMLENASELESAVRRLLNNPQEANELGRKGRELIAGNRGATLRNIKIIKVILSRAQG